VRIKGKAIARQFNGWLDHRLPAQLAIPPVGQLEAADGAWYADDAMAVETLAFLKHRLGGRRRCGLTIIDDGGLGPRTVNEHKAPATNIACCRMRDGQGEGRGNRRIHGIAALLQDIKARIGTRGCYRDDHSLAKYLFLGGRRTNKKNNGDDPAHEAPYHENIL
jgi:hypothetical protein